MDIAAWLRELGYRARLSRAPTAGSITRSSKEETASAMNMISGRLLRDYDYLSPGVPKIDAVAQARSSRSSMVKATSILRMFSGSPATMS